MSDAKNSTQTKGNTSGTQTETVTFSTDDPKRIKELEKLLAEKDKELESVKKETKQEVETIKEKTSNAIKEIKSKNSDDIAPGIRKTNTFGGSYQNAYADGSFQKKRQQLLLDARKAQLPKR